MKVKEETLHGQGRQSSYEDFKYSMQDTTHLYVGVKYTLGEIMENEEISFRFRKLIAEEALKTGDKEDTLETHLYYLASDDFLVQIYKQIKAVVRVSQLTTKRHLFGKETQEYVSKQIPIEELASMTPKQKEELGLILMELRVSKMALASV